MELSMLTDVTDQSILFFRKEEENFYKVTFLLFEHRRFQNYTETFFFSLKPFNSYE